MKMQKLGGSYAVIIPKFVRDSLGWDDDVDLIMSLVGKDVVISKEEKRDE